MNLGELLTQMKRQAVSNPSLLESSVVITLAEDSIGPRAGCGIKHAMAGFDWESGQIRLEPEEPLVRFGKQPARKMRAVLKGSKHEYFCPVCKCKVALRDTFCRDCGQKLKK